ncbi:GGDEF domain-containing response regulator [Noviherbaspirillum pedocola]|uniref:Diguanylate cyclase n=1 Tax=Noviherbaspirillum pedocola TaxID=2801341 RepID=A0A934SVU7_9BURK|nr:diguanylate cyclase [Noviherbaspirillum pedocola]MBK4736549.1 diguanylate cyclase [Noviherbaspirillum pedocola]
MIPADELRNAKILVVDDCEDNVFMQMEILRLAGYNEVSSCRDPSEVVSLHVRNSYDLILLDMHMPGMNGLEVMERLREVEKDSYLPVLAITGDRNFKIAALQAGARDFLTKPYDMTEFQMRIRNMLEVRLLYKKVAEQGRLEKEMALHDALTGLPNRRLLVDRIEKSMQHASRGHNMMAVMYLDLDGFKAVNDTHGHGCGDELLKNVADRLRRATRKEDTVARIGGDEFVIVLSDIAHVDDVLRPASKILRFLSTPFDVASVTVSVSTSIGIAFYPGDGNDVEELISRADRALYDAKRGGKNRYHFSDVPVLLGAAM